MRVWVVWHGAHEEVLAVYSSKEQADAYCQRFPDDWYLYSKCFEVDVDPAEDPA